MQLLASGAELSYEIDRIFVRGTLAQLGLLDAAQVHRLSSGPSSIHIHLDEAGLELQIDAGPRLEPTVTMSGDLSQILETAEAEQVSRAISRNSIAEIFELVAEFEVNVDAVLRNDSSRSKCHWVVSHARLVSLLNENQWTSAASAIAKGPSVVVIQDLQDEEVLTDGLRFIGPNALGRADAHSTSAHLASDGEFKSRLTLEGRPALPSPTLFAPKTAITVEALAPLLMALHGVTCRLVWYWLASEVSFHDGVIDITLSGARVTTLELPDGPARSSHAEIALYLWAVVGSDPARMEALNQASSLAVLSVEDLATAANPTLRTAQSLYALSRQGAIAEALAARRSAREAVLNSARQAAQSARQAAGKSVERVLVQLAAAIAIVLSNATGIIGSAASYWLLAATSVVTLSSYLVAKSVEIPSAENGLDKEVSDLDQYRDTLSSEDIKAIKNVRTVESARSDLRRTRRTVAIVYLTSAVLIPLLAAILSHSKAIQPRPSAPSGTLSSIPPSVVPTSPNVTATNRPVTPTKTP